MRPGRLTGRVRSFPVDRHSVEQSRESASRHRVAGAAQNLPDQLTSFIGRSAELARVRQLLGEARLLTLVGAGGCGKTRLSVQSAADCVERFPDSTWWVELAPLEEAALLPPAVSSALGLRERTGTGPRWVARALA